MPTSNLRNPGNFNRRTVLGAIAAGAVVPSVSLAQPAYPVKPIRLIVPFGPGSFTDVVSRQIAALLSTALGQPVIMDNRPGGSTGVAAEAVARAPADGYTLLIGTSGGMAANPAGMKKSVPYDVERDFTPISHIGSVIYAFLAHPSIPVKNMNELIQYARRNPGLKFGQGNQGGLIYMSMLASTEKLDMLNVPYQSGPPAMNALVAGTVDLMVNDINSALPLAKAGRLNILAIAGSRRSPLAPDVPTHLEAGLTKIRDVPGWIGLYGPAKLPPHIAALLSKEFNAVLQLPEMQAKAANVGLDIRGSTPEGLAQYTRDQTKLWKELIAEYQLKSDD